MKRIRIPMGILAFVVATSLLGGSVWAGPQWCEEDPQFVVNGRAVDVTMLFEGQYASKVKGSVHFDMQVPSNAVAAVVALPGTVPVTASISYTLPPHYGLLQEIPVIVTVSMKASASFPTYTLVTGTYEKLTSTIEGTSTKPTKVKFSLTGL